MAPPLRTALSAALMCVLIGGGAHTQDRSAPSPIQGVFAFPNASGNELLATATNPPPATSLLSALCRGTRRIGVRFDRRQPESPTSNGRQTAQNFVNTAGAIFRVAGKLDPAATCFITADSVLLGATVFQISRVDSEVCPRSTYGRVEADRSRPVVGCWVIAESQEGVRIFVIEFARLLSHALASLAVFDGATAAYIDFPAEFAGPGADLWRVDDGGEIHPESFQIVCLLKKENSYVLGLQWDGAEGSALSLWTTRGGNTFQPLLNESWYRSPL